jgi:hypothetical protein
MKTIKIFTFLIISNVSLFGQFDINFIDKCGYLKFTGGTNNPSEELKRTDETGLYAKNGYFFGFDFNYIISHGFGIGFNFQMDRLNFNKEAFLEQAKTNEYKIRGRFASNRFGLNVLMNIPIVVSKNDFLINLYGEGNAGLRGFNIPSIDLYYSELENKWIELNYRTRINTMGYLGFSAGIQFIISNFFGINVSYSEVLRSRHSIRYHVRMTDAFGNVKENENYLHNYLNSKGLQFGIFFLFGKK